MGGMRCDPTVQHSTVKLTQIVNLAQITRVDHGSSGSGTSFLSLMSDVSRQVLFSLFLFPTQLSQRRQLFFFVFFVVISTLPTDASASPFGTIDTDGTDTLDPLPSLLRIDN